MGRFAAEKRTLELKLVYLGPEGSGRMTNLQKVAAVIRPGVEPQEVDLEGCTQRAYSIRSEPIHLNLTDPAHLILEVLALSGPDNGGGTAEQLMAEADGVVFIADALRERLRANLVAYADFLSHLRSVGRDQRNLPVVFQINKSDVVDGMAPGDVEASINSEGFPAFEASASSGRGVGMCFTEVVRRMAARAVSDLDLEQQGIQRSALASAVDSALSDLGSRAAAEAAKATTETAVEAVAEDAAPETAEEAPAEVPAAAVGPLRVDAPRNPSPPLSREDLLDRYRQLSAYRQRLELRLSTLEEERTSLLAQMGQPIEYLERLFRHLSSARDDFDPALQEALRGGTDAVRYLARALATARHEDTEPVPPEAAKPDPVHS